MHLEVRKKGKVYALTIFLFLYLNVFITFSVIYLLLDIFGFGATIESFSIDVQQTLITEKILNALFLSATTLLSDGHYAITPIGWSRIVASIEETIGFLIPAFIMMKFLSQEHIRFERSKVSMIQLILHTFFVTLGALFVSLGLEFFLVPNHIIDGGIVGISIIMSFLTGLKLEFLLLILNLPFLYLGYKHFGKRFLVTTLLGISILSIVSYFIYNVPVPTENPFLASIFGGVFLGIGVGIVIRSGGSLDGTEIIGILMNRRTSFSIGKVIMFINVFIFCSAGFVFGWDKALFSLLAYYIASNMIDLTVGVFRNKVL